MAYGQQGYNNGYQRQNNYGNGGGYQRQNNTGGGYQRQQPEPKPQVTVEDFTNQRIDVYEAMVNIIKERGHDPADFAFALGGWVTSFALQNK